MGTSTIEFIVFFIAATLLLGWSLWRFRWLRLLAAVVVAANLILSIADADQPLPAEGDPIAKANKAEQDKATLEDGERDWGRDPGIGTTLTPASLIIAGIGSAVVLGLVLWMVSYRKPDGTVHPYDD